MYSGCEHSKHLKNYFTMPVFISQSPLNNLRIRVSEYLEGPLLTAGLVREACRGVT